eukprot:3494258-Alexandrium_andersonii.AAC.1
MSAPRCESRAVRTCSPRKMRHRPSPTRLDVSMSRQEKVAVHPPGNRRPRGQLHTARPPPVIQL